MEFTFADHPRMTSYDVDIYPASACPVDAGAGVPLVCQGTPFQTISIAAGTAAAQPNGDWRLTMNVQPIAFGQYYIIVTPIASAVRGDPSVPSNLWVRAPGAPSKPVVK